MLLAEYDLDVKGSGSECFSVSISEPVLEQMDPFSFVPLSPAEVVYFGLNL